jgi:hypothetical protein
MPMVVDLPAPLGPSRPKTSPARISNEMPSRAAISNFLLALSLSLRAGRCQAKEKPAPRAADGGGEV